ncbi:MAG: RDD family protein [Candidatus Korobacteraceae bacterium]
MPENFDNSASSSGPMAAAEQFSFAAGEDPAWRQEVASRLSSYRVRKKRSELGKSSDKSGTPPERAMPLDFGRVVAPKPEPRAATPGHRRVPAAMRNLPPDPSNIEVAEDPQFEDAAQLDSVWLESPHSIEASSPELVKAMPGERTPALPEEKILQFPRSALNPVFCEELAEPVQHKPRILDVPEEMHLPTAAMVDIGLAPLRNRAEDTAGEFELPLPVASPVRRACAAVIDAMIVLAGFVLFLGLLNRWSVQVPATGLSIPMGIGAFTFFWIAFEYLALVYTGSTPGMRVSGLHLVSLDGATVPRAMRRSRSLGMLISCLPLGMGLAWALFDEDGLCWHDRLSHTYLRH